MKNPNNPKSAKWLREQLQLFIKRYSPLVEQDSLLKDDSAHGRAFAYEQCIGIMRAILEGIPFKEFRWDPKYNLPLERARK